MGTMLSGLCFGDGLGTECVYTSRGWTIKRLKDNSEVTIPTELQAKVRHSLGIKVRGKN